MGAHVVGVAIGVYVASVVFISGVGIAICIIFISSIMVGKTVIVISSADAIVGVIVSLLLLDG